MRIGMAFAQPELISFMQAVKDSYNSYPLDMLAIETACASIGDEDYFASTVSRVTATRDSTRERLREMGFTVLDSQTNFLFAKPHKVSAKELFEYLKSEGIYVRYFNKPRIDGYLRITVGTDEQMKLMCDKIGKFLA
jgi:histidinol-phosphate aminotransferase